MQRARAACSTKFSALRRMLRGTTNSSCFCLSQGLQRNNQLENSVTNTEPLSLSEWHTLEDALTTEKLVASLNVTASRNEFVTLCAQIDPLLQSTAVFDGYLLSIAFIYFQRLGLWVCHYNTRALYAALYLASAMLEDSEEGAMELVTHCVGVSAEYREYESSLVTRKHLYFVHTEWQDELRIFLKPINEFLKRMDWRLTVDCRVVQEVQASFADCHYFVPRKEHQLLGLQARMSQSMHLFDE